MTRPGTITPSMSLHLVGQARTRGVVSYRPWLPAPRDGRGLTVSVTRHEFHLRPHHS